MCSLWMGSSEGTVGGIWRDHLLSNLLQGLGGAVEGQRIPPWESLLAREGLGCSSAPRGPPASIWAAGHGAAPSDSLDFGGPNSAHPHCSPISSAALGSRGRNQNSLPLPVLPFTHPSAQEHGPHPVLQGLGPCAWAAKQRQCVTVSPVPTGRGGR